MPLKGIKYRVLPATSRPGEKKRTAPPGHARPGTPRPRLMAAAYIATMITSDTTTAAMCTMSTRSKTVERGAVSARRFTGIFLPTIDAEWVKGDKKTKSLRNQFVRRQILASPLDIRGESL